MRRLFCFLSSGASARRWLSSGATIENSFAATAAGTETDAAHPLLYQVPVLATRTIGREAEVRSLWQSLLSGRHVQVISGVDGVGKSTIAAEFCDAVKHSQRFSCIQWLNGRRALATQLHHFFLSMKGRKERDVLLVIDDADLPEEVIALIPQHKNVYVLITTSNTDVKSSTQLGVLAAPPLSLQAAAQFIPDAASPSEALQDVYTNLGFVPLLMQVASLLIEGDICSAAELHRILQEKEVMRDNTLRISVALAVLLDIAVIEMEKTYPMARQQLRILSCFHIGDMADALVTAVVGAEGGAFAVMAAQLGFFSLKWEEGAFAMHSLVAKVLQSNATAADLKEAATVLLSLWPRRWRGMGNSMAYNLVWHSYALALHFTEKRCRFPPPMITCLDRAAIFLTHVETRDFSIAAELWGIIYDQLAVDAAAPSTESVRMLREYGRLLHFLKDTRAEEVLRRAWHDSVSVYGRDAPESALILGCLAPYLAADQESIAMMEKGIAVLEERLSSVDVVLGKEEQRMMRETICVLMLCKAQFITEMGDVVSNGLLQTLNRIEAELRDGRKSQR